MILNNHFLFLLAALKEISWVIAKEMPYSALLRMFIVNKTLWFIGVSWERGSLLLVFLLFTTALGFIVLITQWEATFCICETTVSVLDIIFFCVWQSPPCFPLTIVWYELFSAKVLCREAGIKHVEKYNLL